MILAYIYITISTYLTWPKLDLNLVSDSLPVYYQSPHLRNSPFAKLSKSQELNVTFPYG